MTTTPDAPAAAAPGTSRGGVELTGLETIPESERRGRPAGLFWPWFAANVSVFGIAYGAYLLGFGLSFWQATIIGIVGVVFSFFLVGVVSLAGKRGSAPTMVLSRTMFGVHGARVVSVLSWVLTVGWETVLCVSAVYAVDAASEALGFGDATKNPGLQVVALLVVAAIIVALGIFGFTWIMRAQLVITIVTGVATIVFLIAVVPHIDLGAVAALPAGSAAAVIGGLVFMMTGFGLGWVNAGADYSRYLPRSASGRGVVAWTTIGAALPVVVLFVFGVLLAGSSKSLNDAIGAYSLGPLVGLTPAWFLVPFAIVVVLGLIAGAVMDIYSSGLALLSTGLRIPRPAAAAVDGVIMTLLSIYVIFFGGEFLTQFQGFLITLGVPIAAWCGVFIADVILRRKDLDQPALYTARGRYGAVNWLSIALLVVGTVVGWGLVTNAVAWLGWQGYLLFGLHDSLGGANLGVLVALVVGFVGYLIGGRGTVRRQEA
jgi:nucleobase:cation symporter-1, NCS1 family